MNCPLPSKVAAMVVGVVVTSYNLIGQSDAPVHADHVHFVEMSKEQLYDLFKLRANKPSS
jgi:hypothetical protein